MKNLFLVHLKNPPHSFLVDDYNDVLKDEEVAKFTQDGLLLIIPCSANWNIAYINELTDEQAKEFQEVMKKQREEILLKQGKIIKPGFRIPKGKSN